MDAPKEVIYVYRQRLPAFAPQSVQVLSTAHALACAGIRTHLIYDWAYRGENPNCQDLLQSYGLEGIPALHLTRLGHRHPGLAGLEYRVRLWQLLREVERRRAQALFFCRRADYAAKLLVLRRRFGFNYRVVFEWHYVGSENAREAGQLATMRELQQLEGRIALEADAHIAVSDRLRRFLLQNLPIRREVTTIQNGGPLPIHDSVSGLEHEETPTAEIFDTRAQHSIVYLGLFRRPGDLSTLLQAVPLIPESCAILIVGGDEEGKRLEASKEEALRLGVSSRIHFFGAMLPSEARSILRRAKAAIATFAPSINMSEFACPLKILEYQAAGVPVIASDFPTVRELVDDRRSGLLVPPDNAGALADAVRRILDDPTLAATLRADGLKLAAKRSWKQRGLALAEVLNRL